MVDEKRLAEIETEARRGRPIAEYVLIAEIRRLWAREQQLLEANNAEIERRREAERLLGPAQETALKHGAALADAYSELILVARAAWRGMDAAGVRVKFAMATPAACIADIMQILVAHRDLARAEAKELAEVLAWLERKGLATTLRPGRYETGVNCWDEPDEGRRWVAHYIGEFGSLLEAATASIAMEQRHAE